MDADWDELYRILLPPASAHDLPTPASTLAFDTRQELLWVGNEYGRVTSFNGPELRRYTSYRGHRGSDGPVKQFLFHEKGILSVAPTSIHFSSRRGLPIWHIEDETIRNLRCMSFMGKDQSYIIVAGVQPIMLKIDIEKGCIVDRIQTDYEYDMMKQSKYICAATTNGSINLLDVDNLRIVNTFSSNNIGISDMDARNNYLVTCGWVSRAGGGPMLAGLANVYDLRAMVQLPPVPFHVGAAHVQMHPKMSTTCILSSQDGQLQVIDLMNANTVNVRQANISTYLRAIVLAPSGEALAIADGEGNIHIWGSPNKTQFAEYHTAPLDWGDASEPVPEMDINSDVPFSRIGLPYYREQLLSAWSNLPAYEVGDPPSKIDPVILKTARQNEVGFWSPNPRKGQRNLAEKKRIPEESGNLLNAPKFLSEKARETEREAQADNEVDDLQDQLSEALIGNVTKTEVPIMYRNVEIKYSRFGVDDFDFQFYNRTKFSGLETHIANSYTNPLLQLFKFIPLFRNLALQHTATSCLFDTCLLCELGYLFDTMEKAEGQSCQATNFLKTFSSIPQTNRMALLEENNPNSALGDMIQAACRFLLAQARDDFLRNGPAANQFDQILAVDALTSIQCVHCRNETIKSAGGNITDLIYTPLHSPGRGQRLFIPTFSQILKASVEVQTQTRGWCDKCRRYQQLATRKGVRKMPDILMINTALKSAEAKQYWGIPGWLPDSIGIVIDEGKFFCFEGEDLRLHIQKGLHIVKVYDLVGIVVDIVSAGHQKSHLVSIINVDVFTDKDGLTANWHLFNDFLVRKLSKDEGLTYPPSWKVPTVIAYQITAARGQVDSTWKENLDTSLLYNNWSINNQPPENCEILDPAVEAPCAGTFLAVDTEFVSLQHQEIEIKADGNREVVRPTRLGLARVSVLRGAGYQEGVPFINDYITIREDIVDYLTQYSGVAEGDLDPRYSPHNLVTLKVAYKKLWLLVNLGCIFVGHGLPKDFRTVNIHVPRHQVLDTVDLFYIKSRQRKLSLRYLAWYLLKEDIQQDTHDSIEDARTALRLWRKYEEFCDAGIVEPMLEEIYREGKKWGYRPPGEAIVQGGHRISRNAATGDLLHVPTVAGIGPSSLDGRETPDLGMSVPGSPGRRIESVRRVDGFDSPMR